MKNESEKPIEKIVNTQLNCRIFSRAIFQKIGQDLQTSGVRTDQVKVVNILRNIRSFRWVILLDTPKWMIVYLETILVARD